MKFKWKSDEVVTCVIDEGQRNRYSLTCTWDKTLSGVAFIMTNPSTGNRDEADPTLRRCINFAKSWGYGSIIVVNLFSFITPSPDDLNGLKVSATEKEENIRHIETAIGLADRVICAWGEAGAKFDEEAKEITKLIPDNKRFAIEISENGFPKHPLYLKSESKPIEFTP